MKMLATPCRAFLFFCAKIVKLEIAR